MSKIQFVTSCNTFRHMQNLLYWTPGLPDGSIVIALVSPSVGPLVRQSLNISETAHSIFLKLCMKIGVNKVKKVTRPEF